MNAMYKIALLIQYYIVLQPFLSDTPFTDYGHCEHLYDEYAIFFDELLRDYNSF